MFAVVGEAFLDMVQPEPNGDFVARPGGGPLNIAVGLRRLGHPTALMARLSTGPLGEIVRRHIQANDLDAGACVSTDDHCTLAFASLDEQGRASYEFYVDGTADWGWTDAELAALPPDIRALHAGSLAAFLAPGADALLTMWERLRAEGALLLSFDPNVRPTVGGSHDDAVARAERFVAASHVVKASDEDLGWLYPEESLDDVVRRWSTMGPELVVMTLGSEGSTAARSGNGVVHRAGMVVDVVDTIGAGDAFESGLLSAIADLDSLAPGALSDLSDDEVLTLLDRATVVSAMTCRRTGADPPRRAEYDEEVAANVPGPPKGQGADSYDA